MTITAIARVFGGSSNVVVISCDNTVAELRSPGFFNRPDIMHDIQVIQTGSFKWSEDDIVLVRGQDGISLFSHDEVDARLKPSPSALNPIVLAGRSAFVGGLTATIPLPGVVAGDIVQAQFETFTNPSVITSALSGDGSFDLTFDPNPGASQLTYVVIRPTL